MRNVGSTIRRQVDKSDQSPCVRRRQFEKATNMLTSEGYLEYQRCFDGSKFEPTKSRSSRGQQHPLNINNNNIKPSVECSSGITDNYSFRNRYAANSLHEPGCARIADQSYLLAPSNQICSISQFSDGKALNRSRTIDQNKERDETSHSPAFMRLQQTQQQKKLQIQQSNSQNSDQESEYFRHSSNSRGIIARQGKRLLSFFKPVQSHSELALKQEEYRKEAVQSNPLQQFESNYKRKSEYNLILEKEKQINQKIQADVGQISNKHQFSFKLYCKLHGLKQQQQQQQPLGSSVNLVVKQSPMRSGNRLPPQQYQHLSAKQSFSQQIPQSFRNTSKDEDNNKDSDIKDSRIMFPDIDNNDCTVNGVNQKMNLLMKETAKRENLPEQNKSVVFLKQSKNLIDYLNCSRMDESQMEKRCTSGKRQRYSQCAMNRMSAIEKVLSSDGKMNNMLNETQSKRSLTRENELGEIKASVKRIKLKKLAAVLAHKELFMNGSQLGAVQAFRQVISGNNSRDEGDQRQKSKDKKKNHLNNEFRNQSNKEIQFDGAVHGNRQDIMNPGETTGCQFFQLQQYYNKKYEKQLQEYSQSSSSLQLKQYETTQLNGSSLQNESINQEWQAQKQQLENYQQQQQQQEQQQQLPIFQSTSLSKLKSVQLDSIDASIRLLHQSSSSDIEEQSKQENFNFIPQKYQYPHRNLASNIKYFPKQLICKQIETKQKRVKEKGFELQPWEDQVNFNETNFFTKTSGDCQQL